MPSVYQKVPTIRYRDRRIMHRICPLSRIRSYSPALQVMNSRREGWICISIKQAPISRDGSALLSPALFPIYHQRRRIKPAPHTLLPAHPSIPPFLPSSRYNHHKPIIHMPSRIGNGINRYLTYSFLSFFSSTQVFGGGDKGRVKSGRKEDR